MFHVAGAGQLRAGTQSGVFNRQCRVQADMSHPISNKRDLGNVFLDMGEVSLHRRR